MRMDVNFVLPLKNEREVFTFTHSIIFGGRCKNFVSEYKCKKLRFEITVT